VDGSGDVFVAAQSGVYEIVAVSGVVSSTSTVNPLASGNFSGPFGIAVDGSGNVFVADTWNSAVKEILAAGGYTTVKTLGSGLYRPYAVTVDGSGNVFVADTWNNAVKEMLASGGSR
jgi:streptogramin lyase